MKTITTTEERNAFLVQRVSEAGEYAIIRDTQHAPHIIWETEHGEFWSQTWPDEDALRPLAPAEDIPLPWHVIHPLVFTAEDVEKAAAMIHWESLDGTDRHPAEVEWQLLGESERDIYRKLARAVLTNIGEVEA